MVVLDHTWLNLDWLETAQTAIRFVNQWLKPLTVDRKFQKLIMVTFFSLARSILLQIWLGGTPNQTSIARSFMDRVKLQDLEKVFEPLFYHWKQKRQSKESFGDFTTRLVSLDIILFICIFEALLLTFFNI